MRIVLDPRTPDPPSFEIDHQITVALATLSGSLVRIRGVGRFGSDRASIILQRVADADKALAALERAGIHGAMSDGSSSRMRH